MAIRNNLECLKCRGPHPTFACPGGGGGGGEEKGKKQQDMASNADATTSPNHSNNLLLGKLLANNPLLGKLLVTLHETGGTDTQRIENFNNLKVQMLIQACDNLIALLSGNPFYNKSTIRELTECRNALSDNRFSAQERLQQFEANINTMFRTLKTTDTFKSKCIALFSSILRLKIEPTVSDPNTSASQKSTATVSDPNASASQESTGSRRGSKNNPFNTSFTCR